MAFKSSWMLGMSVSLILMFTACSCNQMDPHVYPSRGPYFEGWYQRIIDSNQNVSIGFLFGRVLPVSTNYDTLKKICITASLQPIMTNCEKFMLELKAQSHLYPSNFSKGPYVNSTSSSPLVIATLLVNLNSEGKLDSPTGFFSPSDYGITKNGKPVTQNPDDKTPPQFEAVIAKNVSWHVSPTGGNFSLTIGEHVLYGETSVPVPWGPDGEGPESWLEKWPLPFHWFVYSFRSVVKYYEYRNMQTGQHVKGGSSQGLPVVAHLEKNWGMSFPKAWIWAEGVDIKSNVSFALSGGLVTELGIDIQAQLSGYRNPSKGIDCSFSPVNSIHKFTHDGCEGTATLEVEGLNCAVTFHLWAPPETFSACLEAPMAVGFKKGCTESYNAVANITVYQRHELSFRLTDSHIIHQAALEFGENYMCNGRCPTE